MEGGNVAISAVFESNALDTTSSEGINKVEFNLEFTVIYTIKANLETCSTREIFVQHKKQSSGTVTSYVLLLPIDLFQ